MLTRSRWTRPVAKGKDAHAEMKELAASLSQYIDDLNRPGILNIDSESAGRSLAFRNDFGAVGNGTKDDTAAFLAALAHAQKNNTKEIRLNGGSYYIGTSLTIPTAVSIVGDSYTRSPSAIVAQNLGAELILAPGVTITLGNSSSISGCIIRKYGITYPATQASIPLEWLGTAVTYAALAHSASVKNCYILGFAVGIGSTAGAVERPVIEGNHIDCITGIKIQNSPDSAYLRKNHIWPFATVLAGVPYNKRTGAGIELSGTAVEWARISDNFVFGHQKGFYLQGSGFTLVNCGSDNEATDRTDTPSGFYIDDCTNVVLSGCTAAAGSYGVYCDNTPDYNVSVTGCAFGGIGTAGVYVNDGTAVVTGSIFENMPTAVKVSTTGEKAVVDGNMFKDVFTNTLVTEAGTMQVGDNVYVNCTANSIADTADYTVASAATIAIPDHTKVIKVTGSATITAFTVKTWPGRRITLVSSSGTWTIQQGAVIRLAYNTSFTVANLDAISFIWSGSDWIEIGRKSASVTTITDLTVSGNTILGDAAGDTVTISGPVTSTLATGTAPFVVASTTKVNNLHVARATLADTVTTNANLTGHVTSVGNAAVLGSFTLAQLNTAVSDADVARTDAANTFTGTQTFSGIISATGGQVAFPATAVPSANANTLDDYEEGSWTPTDTSGAALAFTSATGLYQKVGNTVHAWARVIYPATANGSAARIGSLPFTVANSEAARGGGLVTYKTESTLTSIIPAANGTDCGLANATGGTITNATMSGDTVYFMIIYPIA